MFMLPNTGVKGVRPQGRTATFMSAEKTCQVVTESKRTSPVMSLVWLMIERVGDDFNGDSL